MLGAVGGGVQEVVGDAAVVGCGGEELGGRVGGGLRAGLGGLLERVRMWMLCEGNAYLIRLMCAMLALEYGSNSVEVQGRPTYPQSRI